MKQDVIKQNRHGPVYPGHPWRPEARALEWITRTSRVMTGFVAARLIGVYLRPFVGYKGKAVINKESL